MSRVGPIGPVRFTIGFAPTFLAILSLSWSGRFDRLLPAALATLLVAIWPVYRGLAGGDWDAGKKFLFVSGTINVFLLMYIGLDYGRRRGWVANVADSPVRRWVVTGSMFVYFIFHKIGWPTGVWHAVLLIAWMGVSAWGMFWPIRRGASRPAQPVTP